MMDLLDAILMGGMSGLILAFATFLLDYSRHPERWHRG